VLRVAIARIWPHVSRMTDTEKSETTPAPGMTEPKPSAPPMPKEIGGPAGPEPTRYGDWEQKGRCTDF
jgi:hypothetical protein